MPCMRGVHIVGGEYYACRKATRLTLTVCVIYNPLGLEQWIRRCVNVQRRGDTVADFSQLLP